MWIFPRTSYKANSALRIRVKIEMLLNNPLQGSCLSMAELTEESTQA